jgi:nucleotide-binding universal stress UspA family protein
MAYKDLLVHLDGDERSEVRLAVAMKIAGRFGARLTGVYGESDPHVLSTASRDPAAALGATAARVEASFRSQTKAEGIDAAWQTAMTVNDMELIKRVLFLARHADLVVLGQSDPESSKVSVPSDLAEQVILNCGRPVLVVPYAGRFVDVGERVMVAWNGSREAARALNDSLPLLARAKHVTLVAINPNVSRKEYGEEPFRPIASHLDAHGIAAHCESLWVEDIGADVLLSRLTDEAIDLLVMGAHGHYGFPYLHRGGSTRQVLRYMTVPVLMSH